jgi:hypothetical protein
VGPSQELVIESASFREAIISEHTWKTMPEEMIGVIPSSIRVPLLLANIIRSQYRGSDESDETMPYKGIWLMTRKISNVS